MTLWYTINQSIIKLPSERLLLAVGDDYNKVPQLEQCEERNTLEHSILNGMTSSNHAPQCRGIYAEKEEKAL